MNTIKMVLFCKKSLSPFASLHRVGNIGCVALLLMVFLVLVGCQDDADNGNDIVDNDSVDEVGVPTEATRVQNESTGAIGITSITLTWDVPTDSDGYLGVTITEQSGAGSLTDPAELDENAVEYRVTGLEEDTEYLFTLTTRYLASGKNNDAMIRASTAAFTNVRDITIDVTTITSDSITLTWVSPANTGGYTGVRITANPFLGSLNQARLVPQGINNLLISNLDPSTPYAPTFTFTTEYTGSKTGSTISHEQEFTTQSNLVTAVVASNTDATTITLSWADPEDTIDYTGLLISSDVAAGSLGTSMPVNAAAGTARELRIESLTIDTDYTFTLTTQYDNDKDGDIFVVPTRTRNLIDTDGDGLVDINSLERLDNVRYNLDLGGAGDDGRYKESNQLSDNAGLLCGHDGATSCTGYELTRSLDFADGGSYDSGIVRDSWRPTGGEADTATNAGWDPIGSCNEAITIDACDDGNDTPFAARFEGNGYTISNLYVRRTAAINGAVGLFGITNNTAIVQNIGVIDVAVYDGSADIDHVGALVGYNQGTISASYASGGTVNSRGGTGNRVGGLVGINDGSITASHVSNSMPTGGMSNFERIGGLVGENSGTVIASYASGGTVNSGGGALAYVGGLLGENRGIVIASYASGGTVNGFGFIGGLVGGNTDTIIAGYANNIMVNGNGTSVNNIGGLVGNSNSDTIIASYATATASGNSVNNNDYAGSLIGRDETSDSSTQILTASYGFGTISGQENTGVSDSGDRPSMVGGSGTGIAGARQLTAPATDTTTAVASQWNDDDQNTQDAWHFGTTAEAPALQYADYDGDGTDYGCGNTTGTIATIPNMVPTPTGYVAVTCGSTLLFGQER